MAILFNLLRKIKGKRYAPDFYRWSYWTKLMEEIRDERNFQCQCCLGNGWHGHHWFYPPPEKQKRRYIILLCDRCHEAVHFHRWKIPFRYFLGHILHSKNDS